MKKESDQLNDLSQFVIDRRFEDIKPALVERLKVHLLDAIGCAIGALDGPPVIAVRRLVDSFGGTGLCTLISGGKTAPDRAAFWNSALVRYLDFMDNFMASGETCHPSDNIGSLLTIGDYMGSSGKEFLTAMAIAYQVQCRITEKAPIMGSGFDHTTQQGISVAAGVGKLLKLSGEKLKNAISLAGTELNAFAITRSAPLSHWKGLASAFTSGEAVYLSFIAREGITAPQRFFEGTKGFMEALGKHFTIKWLEEDLDVIERCSIKRFNAEVHSQSALEGVFDLRKRYSLTGHEIESIEIDIFQTAYNIIGGGEFGNKTEGIVNKENADHSLPYLVAVLLLDGQVEPEQFLPERINRQDVQQLLKQVKIHPSHYRTSVYPDKMSCHILIKTTDGRKLEIEKEDYHGFMKRPMDWQEVKAKFLKLGRDHVSGETVEKIAHLLYDLENTNIKELMKLLTECKVGRDVFVVDRTAV